MSADNIGNYRVFAIVALVGVTAPQANAQVALAERVVSTDTYPPPCVTFPAGVTGRRDIAYPVVSGYRRLNLDRHLLPGPTAGARPTEMYSHGGGWTAGSPRNVGAFENWSAVLASIAARCVR